jgi:hypothetical protein
MHTTDSSTDGGIPVARTRITLKNVPAERTTLYSDETYDALSARLIGFIHQHMPVRQIVGGLVAEMQVNREDVVTLEPVEPTESPEGA